jgi:hypothetical protein
VPGHNRGFGGGHFSKFIGLLAAGERWLGELSGAELCTLFGAPVGPSFSAVPNTLVRILKVQVRGGEVSRANYERQLL